MAKSSTNGNAGHSPPNKSEAIRDAIAQSPKAKGKDIVATLAKQGIKVQPSLVYMVMSKQRLRQRRAKRESAQATSKRTGASNPIDLIVKTKALAAEAGGIKNLKMLVDLLAE